MIDGALVMVSRLPDGDVPGEFQVFPYGRVEMAGGDSFLVDQAAMDAVIEAFQARGLDMVIDYEHQTLGRTKEADFSSPDGKAPAAGWIKALENRGKDGLWAKVEWTEKARQLLAGREYRYFSPVFFVSKKDRKLMALETVALTNAPRLNWIRPIVAKTKDPKEERTMEILKEMAKALGLAETATQEEVTAAVAKLKTAPAEIVASTEVLEALGLAATAGKSEIVASIHALKAVEKNKPDLEKEVAAMREQLAIRTRDELVAAAMKDGKITPAQREWADDYAKRDPEGFKIFVAKAPVVVPVTSIQPKKDGPADALDDAQREINKQMGIDDETYKKYGPKAA